MCSIKAEQRRPADFVSKYWYWGLLYLLKDDWWLYLDMSTSRVKSWNLNQPIIYIYYIILYVFQPAEYVLIASNNVVA